MAQHAQNTYQASQRRACRLFGLSRSALVYEARPRDDSELREAMTQMAEKHPRSGFRKLFVRLRRDGHSCNHKRARRVYQALGLNLKRRFKRRPVLPKADPAAPLDGPNTCWSADFMSDALANGNRYRTFNLIDDFNREALRIEVDVSLTTTRLIRVLEQVISVRGAPQRLRVDRGPEFTSTRFITWCRASGIELTFIDPGKPMQNGIVERFNGTYRREILNAWVFSSLDEVRDTTECWLKQYNLERPHESLGDLSPLEYLDRAGHREVSTYLWT